MAQGIRQESNSHAVQHERMFFFAVVAKDKGFKANFACVIILHICFPCLYPLLDTMEMNKLGTSSTLTGAYKRTDILIFFKANTTCTHCIRVIIEKTNRDISNLENL
jgi:hypothetical protein